MTRKRTRVRSPQKDDSSGALLFSTIGDVYNAMDRDEITVEKAVSELRRLRKSRHGIAKIVSGSVTA